MLKGISRPPEGIDDRKIQRFHIATNLLPSFLPPSKYLRFALTAQA